MVPRDDSDPPSLYGAIVDDHLARPRHPGPLAGATHAARATNDACGDVVEIELVVEGARIARAAFRAAGCAPALAAGSRLTELVHGLAVERALALDAVALERELGGLPRAKRHAAVLAVQVLRSALAGDRLHGAEPTVS